MQSNEVSVVNFPQDNRSLYGLNGESSLVGYERPCMYVILCFTIKLVLLCSTNLNGVLACTQIAEDCEIATLVLFIAAHWTPAKSFLKRH